jgi:hypothetical protein
MKKAPDEERRKDWRPKGGAGKSTDRRKARGLNEESRKAGKGIPRIFRFPAFLFSSFKNQKGQRGL